MIETAEEKRERVKRQMQQATEARLEEARSPETLPIRLCVIALMSHENAVAVAQNPVLDLISLEDPVFWKLLQEVLSSWNLGLPDRWNAQEYLYATLIIRGEAWK